MKNATKLVGIVMGSKSDWPTMKESSLILDKLKVPHETKIVSAHRTPDFMFEYAKSASERGLEVIIAGAGGAAHLPGMIASLTELPIIGVPIKSSELDGLDSLLSINQMPKGIPVATVAIGKSGAINAGLLATSILANKYENISKNLIKFRKQQSKSILKNNNPKK
tara:strand:+ start:3049 stop:3546 length:498 start_codon:yes stop_codon:yes gene_type:complete